MARPLGSKNLPKLTEAPPRFETLPFTGVARSMECVLWNGFNNFYIVTLTIEDGQVVKKTYSEPYAMFECIARLEMAVHHSGLHLNGRFAPGTTWDK